MRGLKCRRFATSKVSVTPASRSCVLKAYRLFPITNLKDFFGLSPRHMGTESRKERIPCAKSISTCELSVKDSAPEQLSPRARVRLAHKKIRSRQRPDRILHVLGRNLFEFLVTVLSGVAELHLNLHQAVVLADTVGTAE